MAIFALLLNCLAVIAMVAGAARYAFGAVPADYHLAILGDAVAAEDHRVRVVFQAIYRGLAAGMLATAVAVFMLAFLAYGVGTFGAKLATFAIGSTLMLPAFLVTLNVSVKTGLPTPWKPAAGGQLLLLGGFLFSLA